MDITQLQKHRGVLRIIDSPIKMSGTFYVTTEADKVIESMSKVNRITALAVADLHTEIDRQDEVIDGYIDMVKSKQAEIDELVKMLEAIENNAVRQPSYGSSYKDISLWFTAAISDERMMNLRVLIEKHRSK